ncbi:hypothetical protein [Maribacter sp. IgM3_T14_3]|uniref:hypothetical protein n=1 Tax=Maribacter sp. IgM3_T14_3 TaxID=3415140 RepID=UPI003C6EE163|tara:strand:- start:739 stop:1017 length:279 start_codon:yes stop_codon:yes gene_type:complete
MEYLNFKQSGFQVIVFTLILIVSLLFNAMYFLGIIDYNLKTKKKIELIDSPVERPYIDSPINAPMETELIESPRDRSIDSIINPLDSDSIKK